MVHLNNLVALLKHTMSSTHRCNKNVTIKGFYGSKLTDVTDYDKLAYNFGCMEVKYNNVTVNLKAAMKMIKKRIR